jgi:hypothetical protein
LTSCSGERFDAAGFFGCRSVVPLLPVVKEVSSSPSSQKLGPPIVESASSTVTDIPPSGAAELGISLRQPYPRMTESGALIYSYVSKSQMGYKRRVKDKIAKQVHKNKELLAKVVAETLVEGWRAIPRWCSMR